ncbi:TPA: glycosyltransferase [Vibrio cholerae]
MKYLIIDPLGNSSGISSYTSFLAEEIANIGIEYEVISNRRKLSPPAFREYVKDYVTKNYGFDDVIIEAPEAKASTLLIPNEYKVHIRLHCPLAVAQKYDGQVVNENEFSNELRVINKAKIVSSPSYGLLKEMESEVDIKRILVYKNPISSKLKLFKTNSEKQYDLVFMGRMQYLKGYDYIRKIIERLPEDFNVLVFGNNSHKVKLGKNYKCNVDIRDQIETDVKFDLISNAKVLMQLSRFENCSMVILEALSVGTQVVCWNVGGNAEIPSNGMLRPVTKGDVSQLVDNILDICERDINVKDCYEKSLKEVNDDFSRGIQTVIASLLSNRDSKIFRGINKSQENLYNVTRTLNKNSFAPLPKRVFGIAFSNEHVEELWAPVIDKLGIEYRYVCRRNLGVHSVFKKEPYPINERYYCVYDWVKDTDRLIKQISTYKPNIILFHNGLHPIYKKVIERIKKLEIPIIYSELGWFPQYDHVYFDTQGVNGKSKLSDKTYLELVGYEINDSSTVNSKAIEGYHLIATQLDNDTNLIVNSKRFKSRDSFVRYVIGQIPKEEKILLKLHPLDKEPLDIGILSDNVELVTDEIGQLLSGAKSVIAINSTVLLQALEYSCNIYYCGSSILDNKEVAQSFERVELKDILSDLQFCGEERRKCLVDALKSRQINLSKVSGMSLDEVYKSPAFKAFFELDRQDFSNLLQIDEIKKKTTVSSSPNTVNLTHSQCVNIIGRKRFRFMRLSFIKDFFPKSIRMRIPYKVREKFFVVSANGK